MNQSRSWISLTETPGLSGRAVRELIGRFGSPAAVFDATANELTSVPGMTPELADAILRREPQAGAEAERRLADLGARLVPFTDPAFPAALRELPGMPPVLYVTGALSPRDERAVAVIGSRRSTPYGRLVAERLAGELALEGITVVSGLARGIDTVAHRAALEAGGRTIAVLGCGIDRIYPRENRSLRGEVAERGAVVTEFGLGAPPLARNFPARNRIISGLSLGVVAVEARMRSGVLSTVRWALEQGREVFAVPGNIDSPASEGTNFLIQEGAKLVRKVEDILEEFGIERTAHGLCGAERELTEEESALVERLSSVPTHIDSIVREMRLSVADALGLLLVLEMKGMVRQVAGKSFVRTV
jgi:DNA processing protein